MGWRGRMGSPSESVPLPRSATESDAKKLPTALKKAFAKDYVRHVSLPFSISSMPTKAHISYWRILAGRRGTEIKAEYSMQRVKSRVTFIWIQRDDEITRDRERGTWDANFWHMETSEDGI